MEKSSFFNSVSHDRTYKAEDWAEYFASFIGNGVFPVPSTGLQVVANDGMKLNVKTGKAWINGYFYFNTGDLAVELPAQLRREAAGEGHGFFDEGALSIGQFRGEKPLAPLSLRPCP